MIVILEETVEYASDLCSRSPYINLADKFRRVNDKLAGLLRDERPTTKYCSVIYLSVNVFTAKLYIGRGLDLLAPESVETRKSCILKARNIDSLVELECSRKAFSDNDGTLADIQAHK